MNDAQTAWAEWRAGMVAQSREAFLAAHPAFIAGYRQSLLDAADAIQALHPGEVKNSVVWLRARAESI